MSIRAFAAHLGVSVSAVLNWEGRGSAVRLRTETQQMLDVDLARCESEIQQRFTAILTGGNASEQPSSDLARPTPPRAERTVTALSAHDDPLTGSAEIAASVAGLCAKGLDLPDRPWSSVEATRPLKQWLIDHSNGPVAGTGCSRVGIADVEAVQAMSVAFADADHRLGGGYACSTLLHYAATVVSPMLHGSYDDRVGRHLFAAAARLCDLAGFMCFDSGRHGLGQQLFAAALRMAKVSDDPVLGAHILADMAIQAHHLSQTRDALALAEAGTDAARRTGSASTLARCLAIQSRAMAQAGDATGSDAALNQAEVALGRVRHDDEPEWIKFFTEQQLATESMYVSADLGRSKHVRRHAAVALTPVATMQRRQVLAATTLAGAHLTASRPAGIDVEQACHILGSVTEILPSLTSTRARHAVNTVRRRLSRYATNPAVAKVERDLQAAAGRAV